MKIKKVRLEGIYEVVHEAVDTDHYVYSSKLVKASSAKEAKEIYNKYAKGNIWLREYAESATIAEVIEYK